MQDKSEKGSTSRFDLRAWFHLRYRYAMIGTGLLYPWWGPLYHWLEPGKFDDSLTGRISLGVVSILLSIPTFFPQRFGKSLAAFFFAFVAAINAHVFYLVVLNNVDPLYVLGGYCVMFASGALLFTPRSLSLYYVLVVLTTGAIYGLHPDAKSLLLLMGAICSLSINFLSTQVILALLKALDISRAAEEAQSMKLGVANREIANVMNSLGQGFLSFNASGICGENFSSACLDLLETNPAGQMISHVIAKTPAEREELDNWFGLAFKVRSPARDALLENAPSTFIHSAERNISLEYKPVVNEVDDLLEVVVVATDRTNEYLAKAETKREHERMRMITTIIEQRASFQPYLRDLREQLQGFSKITGDAEVPALLDYKRFLHTTKGAFALFAMDPLARYVHDLEGDLTEEKAPTDKRELLALIHKQSLDLQKQIEEFIREYGNILGRTVTNPERTIELPLSQVKKMITAAERPAGLEQLRGELLASTLRPIGEYFQSFATVVRDVSERLGKSVAPLEVKNANVTIYPERLNHLINTFVHVFRNAVDHGLETPEERFESGKPEMGRVTVDFLRSKKNGRDELEIIVEDDGRGIDPANLRKVLANKGLAESYAKASDEQVLMALFEPGFSTKDVATDLSGRGVGLDAMKAAAEALGGSVILTSKVGQGTRVVVTVPDETPGKLALHPAS